MPADPRSFADSPPDTEGSAGRPQWATTLLTYVTLLALAALTWWYRAPLHAMPFERDEGAYATIGARVLAGDTLYRDLFDHKPPLTHLVFALATLAPGDPVVAVRMLATIYLLLTGGVVFLLGRRLYGRAAALAATALLLAYGSSWQFQGLTFNTEAVLMLPALAGCALAVSAIFTGRPRELFWAGLCVGLAALAKPVGLALVGPLLLAPLLARWPLRRSMIGAALGLIGVGLPLLALGLTLWLQGALAASAEALISYNQLYAAESLAQGWNLSWLWRIWAPMLPLVLPALLGFIAASLWRRTAPMEATASARRAAHWVVALWCAALLATALASLRAYPHYYLAAVPLLSLLAAAGLGRLGGWLTTVSGRSWLGTLAVSLLTTAMVVPAVAPTAPLRALDPQAQIAALYDWDGPAFFAPAADVADYVASLVASDEPIFVWASEPQIYLLAQRRPASRFVYDYPVDRLPGAREELLETLRSVLPPVIITYRDVRPIGVYPFFDDYGYTLAASIGGFDIFTRADVAP